MAILLETERTFMREILGNDFEFLLTMMSDAEVMRFYPKPYAEKDVRAFIDRMRVRYREDGCGLWLVVDRESGQPLGRAGLMRQVLTGSSGSSGSQIILPDLPDLPVKSQDEFEVGYMIDRQFWRRGFATEAAMAVRDWAFAERKLPRVISLIRPENTPSQGVARKLGMEVAGRTDYSGMEHLVFAVESPAR